MKAPSFDIWHVKSPIGSLQTCSDYVLMVKFGFIGILSSKKGHTVDDSLQCQFNTPLYLCENVSDKNFCDLNYPDDFL